MTFPYYSIKLVYASLSISVYNIFFNPIINETMGNEREAFF